MTIRTRPIEDEDSVGSGPYCIRLEFEELQLIAAYLGMTRLGKDPYKTVAFDLLQKVEELAGTSQFTSDAFDAIAPMVTVETSSGAADTYDGVFCTIEV